MFANTELSRASTSSSVSSFTGSSSIVPNSLKFTSAKRGIGARRVPVKLRSEQQSYASNNNKLIRILFPNNCLYDTRNGYLTFTLAVSTTGGTYKRVHTGIFSIFNRLRVVSGSTEVEDLRDYNRIYSALWQMINPPDVTTAIGDEVMGFGTTVQRNALGAVSTDYACPLFSGMLNTELLPFDNLSGNFYLDLYLEDGTACIETDGTIPIITISNILFHVERLELEDSYRNFIKNYVFTNGLEIGFHTWERYINSLTAGTQQNLTINHKSSSMNGMLNFLINSAEINNPLINDRFITWTRSPGGASDLTTSSLIINGATFPDEPIDCLSTRSIEPFQMYCRWIMKWKLNGFLAIAPPIENASFINNRFVQIDDLEAYPEEIDLINPFSTLGNSTTLIKKINFSAVIPGGWQLDSWVEYFKQISIRPNGTVTILQ